MSPSPFFIFSILLALACFVLMVVAHPDCGYVYDGSTPLVDIQSQQDASQLRANWYGFGGSSGSTGGSTGTTGGSGFTYQVAIISEKLAENRTAILESGYNVTSSDKRCRSTPGFKGKPDVQNFKTVSTDTMTTKGFDVEVWKSGKLNLTRGTRYYVVLKVSGNGGFLYTNSDGVTISQNSSGSDDDDEFPPYKAGLIAMGIAICCLLVLLLLLILVAKGKGEDKYTTTVHRNENVDKL
jgi:hypothetical protein